MADSLHAALRATIAADLRTVRTLRSPGMRALALVPIAALLLLAAPVVFELRNVTALGLTWSWGASLLQIAVGIALVGAALREAVPGRSWSTPVIVSLLVLPLALIIFVTFASWQRDPVVV